MIWLTISSDTHERQKFAGDADHDFDYDIEHLYDKQIYGVPVDAPLIDKTHPYPWQLDQELSRELEHVVRLNGIDYVWIYRVLPKETPQLCSLSIVIPVYNQKENINPPTTPTVVQIMHVFQPKIVSLIVEKMNRTTGSGPHGKKRRYSTDPKNSIRGRPSVYHLSSKASKKHSCLRLAESR